MAELRNKADATWDKVAGAVKEKTGDILSNEQMEVEGKAQRLKGEAEMAVAKAEEHTAGTAEKTKGQLRQAVGNLIDDEGMQAQGKVEELKGEAKRQANR